MDHGFEFEIAASHIKGFGAAVTALSAVGREVCLGVSPAARSGEAAVLTLTAYDDAATCFGTFRFEERFFTRARVDRRSGARGFGGFGGGACGDFACKILAKALFPALKRASARCHAGGGTGASPGHS